MSINAVV